VFVAQDPSNTIFPLAFFEWHVIYHANFMWKGTVCTGVMTNGRFDIGPTTAGAPPDPKLQTLLKKPKDPFYNDLAFQAKNDTWNNLAATNYVEKETRDPSIPGAFYT
jgi:hypothetical protein